MNMQEITRGNQDMLADNVSNKAKLDSLASKLKAAKASGDDKITQAAEQFESVFLSEMFNHMFSNVGTDATFGGGPGEDMWKSVLVQEYAKVVSRTGGIGVAEQVKREMLKIQEQAGEDAHV